MPSTTRKQRRFMAAAANNPKFAKRAGVPQRVAKEFHTADNKALARRAIKRLT
jgi:hypothetical protein